MRIVRLKALTEKARKTLFQFGDEWVVDNDTGSSLVVTDLDESTSKSILKRHDPHFEIVLEAA